MPKESAYNWKAQQEKKENFDARDNETLRRNMKN